MKIAILDENESRGRKLTDFLKNYRAEWNVYYYTTPFALVTGIYDTFKGDIDLVFSHLCEDDDERIAMAGDLQSFFSHIRVIFYSENSGCAENIFKAEPSYFLNVPIKKDKIITAVDRVLKHLVSEQKQILTVKSKGQLHRLKLSELKYVENSGRKLLFYTDSGTYESYMKMDEIMAELPGNFVQSHRSYAVNTDKISVINSTDLILFSGERIPVARTYQKSLKNVSDKLKGV